MGRLTTRDHPQSEIEKLDRRIRDLETRNPLNNASTSGRVRFNGQAAILLQGSAHIEAGDYTLSPAGLMVPWNNSRFSMQTVLEAIDGRARGARDRADSAHDRITTVSGNLSNVANRVDAVNDRVDTVSTRSTNALNRANSAYSLAQGRATVASVNAARNRADSAYSLASGRVTQAQRNALVARMNMIIAAMEVRSGHQRPPMMS